MGTKLNQDQLRRLMQLEMKKMMDEDALIKPPKLGDPYYTTSIRRSGFNFPDHHNDHECDVCAAAKHPTDCNCDVCSMQRYGVFEACGCDESYVNPYTSELEPDFDDHHDDGRHSSYMARPQLYKIAKYASALLDMVDEHEELEDWQESKIAQISQMIGSVYHSLDYHEEHEEDEDLLLSNLT